MSEPGHVREVLGVFLRLGTIAFGGPAAHIAMMREDLVRRRGWVDDERFLDLVGATNLVPGPNSTELAIHLGHDRAGWRGLVVAGTCFIVPAAAIVTALAWVYVEHGSTPAFTDVLRGVVPAVLAVVAWAVVALLRTAVWAKRSPTARVGLGLLATAALAAYLLGANELLVLLAGALAGAAAYLSSRSGGPRLLVLPLLAVAPDSDRLVTLFGTMLKIGSVLYGSGYVLLAFLEGDFVGRLGWITQQQLLDAVSIGQVTPGPLFTTATFVGYLVAGLPGAFLATVAIFLPSFLFVGLLTRITGRLRSWPWTAAALDGLNATALALMAGVSLQLGDAALVDAWTVGIFLAVLVLLWRTRLNNAWYVAGGALAGIIWGLVG